MQRDGPIFSSWKMEGTHLVRTQVQPSQDIILDFNAELRKNKGALRHLSFAGLELNIPEIDFYVLLKKYPDLGCPDAEIKTKAWRKFIGTSESDKFRVRDRRRARAIT